MKIKQVSVSSLLRLCVNLGRHAEIFPPGEEGLAVHVCRLNELVHRDLKIKKIQNVSLDWYRKEKY